MNKDSYVERVYVIKFESEYNRYPNALIELLSFIITKKEGIIA